jgi:hypothetical protein
MDQWLSRDHSADVCISGGTFRISFETARPFLRSFTVLNECRIADLGRLLWLGQLQGEDVGHGILRLTRSPAFGRTSCETREALQSLMKCMKCLPTRPVPS